MFPWASLQKAPPSIHRGVLAAQRLISRPCSSSSLNSSGGFGYNEDRSRESTFYTFLRSISSGVLIVGSSLGFCYCSSYTTNANPFVSYADYPKERTWTVNPDQCQQLKVEKKSRYLFGDAYRRKVFFKYEKRIRMQSPPEKVFEYFASVRSPSGEVFMTPADLMRAVVPVFPPTGSSRIREGFLRGETIPGELHCPPSEFFMLFDTNNDGLISFPEYIFFVTLLSIPNSSFSVAFKMFDLNNNGEIDREEFKKVMALMRSQNRQGAQHRDGRRFGAKVSVENGGVVEYFFGKDGTNCLQIERFVQFLSDLHNEILRLEFSHYDYKSQGSISAKDFALSLVASADINHISKLLDRVEEISNEPELRDKHISFEEFKEFAKLRKQLQSFSLAIFSYGKVNGGLTKLDFQRAASQVCGIFITNNVVDIIFHVFDANRDGDLSANELVRVLQRREGVMPQPGFGGLISCWFNCVSNNCPSGKLQFY